MAELGAFKLVTGYPVSSDIDLALERGEITGRCGWSWDSLKSRHPLWLAEKKINILVIFATARNPEIPADPPLVGELTKTDEQRQILKLIPARQVLGRPFFGPPGIPEDRKQALRTAFDDTMRDPDFIAEARKIELEINPVPGSEIDGLMAELDADISMASQWQGARDAAHHWWLVLRCSWLGAILGAVPGLGSTSIDWIAYGHAMRTEKNTELFGTGDIRGVIAAESSNNAKGGGHLVPTIAFGVPAGASMGLLLSAFLIHGFIPGPEMLTKHLDVTYSIIWSLTIAHIMGAGICLSASGLFARLAMVRAGILLPLVLAVVFIGAFQATQSWGDVYSVVLFGAFGWAMKQMNWPRPPLILGFVLGAIFERYFFISTEIYGAEWVTRPVVMVVLAGTAWVTWRPLRDGVADTVRSLGRARLARRRLDASIAFAAILFIVAVALWFTTGWPADAKLVPQTACYATLFFGLLNITTEILVVPEVVSQRTKDLIGGGPKLAHHDVEPFAPTVWRARAARYFIWLIGFLALGIAIGFLPAIWCFVVFMMRFEFRERGLFSLLAQRLRCWRSGLSSIVF